jgi:CheY-like chemotaxis protein
MLLRMILDDYNITYHIANDGAEGVMYYKHNSYDLILMDENMPNMNGIEATKHIRELEKQSVRPQTPIIAVTANALNEDKQRFLDAGMDDYISKPYTEDDILVALKKFLK